MEHGSKHIQIVLAVSIPRYCQTPTSFMDSVHWLNMDVSFVIRLYDTCLRTLQPADLNYDGTYLGTKPFFYIKLLKCLIASNRPYRPQEDGRVFLPSSNSTKQHECVALARAIALHGYKIRIESKGIVGYETISLEHYNTKIYPQMRQVWLQPTGLATCRLDTSQKVHKYKDT
jgi:hypothetical protein